MVCLIECNIRAYPDGNANKPVAADSTEEYLVPLWIDGFRTGRKDERIGGYSGGKAIYTAAALM